MTPQTYTQSFRLSKTKIKRIVKIGEESFATTVPLIQKFDSREKTFFVSKLSAKSNFQGTKRRRITIIDLFSGGGGLSLGVHEGLKNMGFEPRSVLAADLDLSALRLLQHHFDPLILRNKNVESLLQYQIDHTQENPSFYSSPKVVDDELSAYRGKVDLLVGGPPCQGHSNLNNWTRRKDPRNLLYYTLPAMALALDIPNIIIENVRAIQNASENVVETTEKLFTAAGYKVEQVILNASEFGVAQARHRHFLVASKNQNLDIKNCLDSFKVPAISFAEAVTDLPKLSFKNKLIETVGELSEKNVRRVDYLHDNNIDNLPNHERPECHQEDHTYPSVYGRIRPDRPMTTITTGFASPGRGRYVHPFERRVINIREAARLQSFPDWYWEPIEELGLTRGDLNKIIGDAVPAQLVEPLLFSLFDAFANPV